MKPFAHTDACPNWVTKFCNYHEKLLPILFHGCNCKNSIRHSNKQFSSLTNRNFNFMFHKFSTNILSLKFSLCTGANASHAQNPKIKKNFCFSPHSSTTQNFFFEIKNSLNFLFDEREKVFICWAKKLLIACDLKNFKTFFISRIACATNDDFLVGL